jgi:hypothetical protein
MKNNLILTNIISYAVIVGLGLITYIIIEPPFKEFIAAIIFLSGLCIVLISNDEQNKERK